MAIQPAIVSNPFRMPMERSYITALVLSGYTVGVLDGQQSVTGILPLYNLYIPLHTALQQRYDQWRAAAGLQKGKTASIQDLLVSLRADKIEDWDLAIQQQYRKGTPRYLELLPRGREPFQQGKQSERISAIDALDRAIGTDVALASLKTDVSGFYKALDTAQIVQKGALGDTALRSDDVEAAVEACTVGLFQVYGGLVSLYAATPERIGDYFYMELIVDKEQRAFTGSVGISATKNIAKRTLEPTAQIRIANPGTTSLRFYYAAEANDGPGLTSELLPAGEDVTVPVSNLGSGPYLKVLNESRESAGAFDLVIL